MIINEQGKLFGKVSIVDISIVLIVLITICVLLIRIFSPMNILSGSSGITCEYTITVKNVRMESVEAMKKSVGKSLYDTQKVNLGKVKELIEVIPSEGFVYRVDGTVAKAAQPERYDMKVRVEASATKAKSGVLIGGKKELSNGSRLTMSSPEITVETQVSDITTK